jgi:hypothetical protein
MVRNAPSPQMQQCIQQCLNCYRVCQEMAMNHCLEEGGKHVEPHHFRLMVNCSEICQTAASFMLGNSDIHAKVCAVCAEVCDACAQSCREVGGMDECVRACEQCAESCRQMAGTRPGKERATRAAPVKAPM